MNIQKAWQEFNKRKSQESSKFKKREDKLSIRGMLDKYLGDKDVKPTKNKFRRP